MIPFFVLPNDPEKPVELSLKLVHSVCDEICIPLENDFNLTLAPDHSNSDADALIGDYLKQVSRNNGYKGLKIKAAGIDEATKRLVITASSENAVFESTDIFIEQSSNNFRFPKPEIEYSDDKKEVVFYITYQEFLDKHKLLGQDITMTLVNNNRAVEMTTSLTNKVPDVTIKKKLK